MAQGRRYDVREEIRAHVQQLEEERIIVPFRRMHRLCC